MIYLLTVINLFNYLDRYLVAALLPHLTKSFSLTHAEGGFLVSSFVCGYVVASPLAGFISGKFNRAKFAFVGVLIFALSTLLCAYAPSYTVFVIARIGIGLGEGIFSTIVPALISTKVNDQIKLTKVFALFFSAIPVGAALGYLLGGVAGAYWGWQSAFVIAGIGSAISSVTLLNSYWNVSSEQSETKQTSWSGMIEQVWNNIPVRLAILGYAFHTFSLQAISAFVSTYSEKVLNLNPDAASQTFGIILVVTGFLGTWIGGIFATKYQIKYGKGAELTFIARCAYATAVLLGIAFIVPGNLFYGVAAGAELAAFLTVAPINATLINNVAPAYKTVVQGMTILIINMLGSLLGPVIVGWSADHFGLALSLQLTTISMVVAGVFWMKSSAKLKR